MFPHSRACPTLRYPHRDCCATVFGAVLDALATVFVAIFVITGPAALDARPIHCQSKACDCVTALATLPRLAPDRTACAAPRRLASKVDTANVDDDNNYSPDKTLHSGLLPSLTATGD